MQRSLALLALAACAAPAPKPPPPRDRQPVVVAIVVDQLAAWMAAERLPLLPATGGFARLRREGTWWKDARYAHSNTDTGPGHASLYTGVPPRENGIWGNERVDDDGVKRSIFRDPAAQIIAPGDLGGGVGSSALPLRRPLLADRLRAARPDAVIISVSLKDRAAILGGGRRPTVALWFDRDLDTFVTSSVYASDFPAWAVPIAGHEALLARRARPWTPADPAWIERNARVPDDGPGEGDLSGFGTTFPHDFAATKEPARAFRGTPQADAVILDVAQAAIERLARPDAPLFVALSMTANDYIVHLFGPLSREAWDGLYQLDGRLGRFFAFLDARYGADGWTAVLTADHGSEHPFAHRLVHKELARHIDEAAVRDFGPGHWVAGVADPYLFLTAAARALPPDRLQALIDVVLAELRRVPGVAGAFDARQTAEGCPPETDDSVPALLCRMLPPTDDPRIYVLLADDGGWDPEIVIGTGGNHGSPRLEDRSVPLIVRAPGRVPGGRVVDKPVTYHLFGETLGALLGLR